MDCVHQFAPRDEELVMLAFGEEARSPEVAQHIEQCEICQLRLARYRDIYRFLVARLYRRHCPSGLKLSYYCAGLLLAEERQRIAAHILDCPLCAEEVGLTRRFLADALLPPSPASPVRRIVGSLVRQQAQLVLRGEERPALWPRQYRAEDVDLSLHLSRAGNGDYILLGIVTSIDPAVSVDAFEGSEAELLPVTAAGPYALGEEQRTSLRRLARRSVCTSVDDLGNIVFSAVPAGEYTLVLRLPEREVVIEGLAIEAGGATSCHTA